MRKQKPQNASTPLKMDSDVCDQKNHATRIDQRSRSSSSPKRHRLVPMSAPLARLSCSQWGRLLEPCRDIDQQRLWVTQWLASLPISRSSFVFSFFPPRSRLAVVYVMCVRVYPDGWRGWSPPCLISFPTRLTFFFVSFQARCDACQARYPDVRSLRLVLEVPLVG